MTDGYRHQVGFDDEYDGAGRLHDPARRCPGRRRTLRIRYHPSRCGGFDVEASGADLPDDNATGLFAHLDAEADVIHGWVDDLLRAWSEWLVDWAHPDEVRSFPFAAKVDHRDLDGKIVRNLWQRLAEAGHKLFRQLFQGDEALEELGAAIARALHAGDQVITVSSDEVIVPWPMLYVPEDVWTDQPDDFEVDLDSFVGHRHLVEHAFAVYGRHRNDVRVTGRIAAGAYYDAKLHRPAHHTLGSALDALSLHTRLERGTSAARLSQRLRQDGANDHLVYFCCHCVTPRAGQELLHFGVEAGERVSAGDLRAWLRRRFQHRPLVMINACGAGRVARRSLRHFSSALLERGAGAVIGPVVNIPTVFAGAFAQDFFERVLPGHRPVQFATVTRDLVRGFAKEQHNLLALTYMLYQGIDGHFCREEPDADAAADG
jgi:hypothetical protein